MNPKTQECFGHYGYGTGYFIRESKLLARINHEQPMGFCDSCPKKNECWQEHKSIVEMAYPIETSAFIAAMDQEKAAGDPQAGGHLAVRLANAGNPDPWLKVMMKNLQLGIKEKSQNH